MLHYFRLLTFAALAVLLLAPLYATSCDQASPANQPETDTTAAAPPDADVYPSSATVRLGEGSSYFLAPGEWINTPPLTEEYLQGRVVLVDFWDYTCVNCLRTLPYLRAWYERYSPYGFEIIGVHTPEFDFAQDPANVLTAVSDLDITWPVVLDNDYQTWQAFDNHYWPHHFLFDAQGKMIYDHIGEGNYGHTEQQIQKALRAAGVEADFPAPLEPVRDTDLPGAVCYRVTPETYLGFARGQAGNPEGLQRATVADYSLPGALERDEFYLDGRWQSEREHLTVVEAPATLVLPYRAAAVNLVLHPPSSGPARLRLLLDGQPLPAPHAGQDVTYEESGPAYLPVTEPRMYYLVDSPQWGEHTLTLEFLTPDTQAFAFTFGTACVEPAP